MKEWFDSVVNSFQTIAEKWYVIFIAMIVFLSLHYLLKGRRPITAKQIAVVGMMSALTIILKQFTHSFGVLGRIELIHMPIIIGAMFFGPGVGFAIGFVGDFLGGILAGYSFIPMVFPFAYGLIGYISGILLHKKKNDKWVLLATIIIFLVSNFLIEFLSYLIYFETFEVYPLGYDIRTAKYFAARVWRFVWQLPLFVIVIPLAMRNIRVKR